jgi:TRAP-type C4-dicarboxylate transport system substrate-binding protein
MVDYRVINKDAWSKISSQDQKAIMDLKNDLIDYRALAIDESNMATFEILVSMPNKEYIELSADEVAKFEAAAQNVIVEWVTDMTAKGYRAADYVEYIEDRIAYWSERQP